LIMASVWWSRPWVKPAWALVLACPGLLLLWQAFHDGLGANPAEALTRGTGEWALRGLVLVLLLRPLKVWTGSMAPLRLRRYTGVAVFIYGVLHLLCWAWFEQGFDWADAWADVLKRPFIWVGVLTWLTMLPLALTSNNASVRRLGVPVWQRLHRLVYASAVLAVVHFWWMREGKQDFAEVWVYGALMAGLLVWRLRARAAHRATSPQGTRADG
jgi:sulfoxide reductase heme-binding subunit YedZ